MVFLAAVVLLILCVSLNAHHRPIGSRFHTNENEYISKFLATTTTNMAMLQYTQRYRHVKPERQRPVVVVVSQSETRFVTQQFQDQMFEEHKNIFFLHTMIENDYNLDNLVNRTINTLESHLSHIPTVMMFLDSYSVIVPLLQAVCASLELKWTHMIHSAEWILATMNVELIKDLACHAGTTCLDFFTFIIGLQKGTGVARTSKNRRCLTSNDFKYSNASWSVADLSFIFSEFSKPKKVSLDGMHLKVGVVEGVRKQTVVKRRGNDTVLEGYVMNLLDLVSRALNFKFTLVPPADDWNVGSVLDNGSATGLTGMIARKEIAFSCMGMSKTENRLQAIDYLEPPIYSSPIFATYRLPQLGEQLDTTLIDIIHPEYVLACLGPVILIALIGSVLHVMTKKCTVPYPAPPTRKDWRLLSSFPEHACFYSPTTYAGQTGRILRGSWAIFCFIFAAAYSAHLITTFAVKPRELKLDSLQTIVSTKQYNFGVMKLNPALVTALQFTNDSLIRDAWTRFDNYRRSNPSLFANHTTVHVKKIAKGDYILLDHFNVQDTELYDLDTDISDIRSYRIHTFDNLASSYWTLPKNAFFKDDISMAIVIFEESGVLKYLREKYNVHRPASKEKLGAVDSDQPVTMSRILIMFYAVGAGTGLSLLCLVIECIVAWYLGMCSLNKRKSVKRSGTSSSARCKP